MVKGINFSLLTFIFLSFFSYHAWSDDLKLQTKLSTQTAEVGDRVILSIDVISNSTQVNINDETQNPRVEGLEFLNRSTSTSTNMSFVNGTRSVTYTQTLNLFFTPTKIGRVKIPKLPIRANGKTYFSKPVVLQVVKEVTQQQRRAKKKEGRRNRFGFFDDDNDIISKFFGGFNKQQAVEKPEFFVDAEVENLTPYEGEQFIVKWYVYTNGALSQFDTLKFPTLRGFWKEDVEFAQNFRWRRFDKDGKTYRRALMSSYALTPYKSGTLKIDSFDLRATVSSTSFGLGRPKVFRVKSNAYELEIKPLPEPTPELFSGGVGDFELEIDDFPKSVKVGEPFKVAIRIKGNMSNVKFLDDLKIDLGEDFAIYEKKEDVKFFPNQASYIKRVDYLLLAKKEGQGVIPDLKFVYFNTQKEDYDSIYLQFPVFKIFKPDPSSIKIDDLYFATDINKRESIDFKFMSGLPFSAKIISPSIYALALPLILAFILGFFGVIAVLLKQTKAESFIQKLQKDAAIVKQNIESNDYNKALESMINLVSLGVGALSGKKFGVEQTFEKSVEMLPVGLASYKSELIDLNDKLQTLRFSRGGSQNKTLIDEYYKEFLIFKDKTISYLERE